MPQYLYVIRRTSQSLIEDMTETESSKVLEHFEYLKTSLEERELILAGRTQNAVPMGIVVFEAADPSEATAFMQGDPAVAAGIFAAELFPFGVALSR